MADDDFENDVRSVVFPKKLLKKFILLYKDLPCLWNRDCPMYKHKLRRHEAITRLTELVQQHDPTATQVHVLRKIESLRACVRREHKRVRDSRRKAKNPDEVYKPHLWYYELFSFVVNDEGGLGGHSGVVIKTENKEPEQESEEDEEEYEEETHFEQSMDPGEYSLANSMVEVTDNSKNFHNYEEDSNKSLKRHCTEVDDEYDAIGVNVAAKLRNLPPNMRILSEKLINDVLFQAQVNGLNSSSVISTPDPFKQDPL